ncbi:MAG: extracellular solute-binding protein [Hyphomicrobiales bacterium]
MKGQHPVTMGPTGGASGRLILRRREALIGIGAGAALPFLPVRGLLTTKARALQTGRWLHGLSLFGDVKYRRDFKHFDYVNPDAPKGGRVCMSMPYVFDSLNPVPLRGDTPPLLGLMYNTLLTSSLDEPYSSYGLLASAVRIADDLSRVTYRLRPRAAWHDGRPITPDDVVWSFETWKTFSPYLKSYYRNVTRALRSAEHDVTFSFAQTGNNRELGVIVGEFPILPRHWWQGTDADGKKRDIAKTTLEVPLGSGPYRIKQVTAGRKIIYERVPDYWGRDLPVSLGRHNLNEIHFIPYGDRTVSFQAFKAGELDYFRDATAKNWVTGYDFPAAKRGDVVKHEFSQSLKATGEMYGWGFNLRREKFSDRRVRRAFNLAYDFEGDNRTLMYNVYHRIKSYWGETELASHGVPQGLELEILKSLKNPAPKELFAKPYELPVSGTPVRIRRNLREATRLLREAGLEIENDTLVNMASSTPFRVEMLSYQPAMEVLNNFYKKSLTRLGIEFSFRVVDSAQYFERLRTFDFDMIAFTQVQSLSPGNEQRGFWGSQAADRPGSDNILGIKNPAVDELIDRIIAAKTRAELVAATHALDRVLLWNEYVVPRYTAPTHIALWNRYSYLEPLPEYSDGFPSIWWWDEKKARAIKG